MSSARARALLGAFVHGIREGLVLGALLGVLVLAALLINTPSTALRLTGSLFGLMAIAGLVAVLLDLLNQRVQHREWWYHRRYGRKGCDGPDCRRQIMETHRRLRECGCANKVAYEGGLTVGTRTVPAWYCPDCGVNHILWGAR